MENKGKLIMLVGIPGSGKSTIAKEMGRVLSSDDVRKELFGDESSQTNKEKALEYLKSQNIDTSNMKKSQLNQLLHETSNKLVFDELHKRVKTALESGESVVYDATNITKKKRKAALKDFEGYYDKAMAVYINTPLSTALDRNSKRERKVSKKVIKRMYKNLQPPHKSEGFDEIMEIKN